MSTTSAVRESMIHYITNREYLRRKEEPRAWWVGSYDESAPFPSRLKGYFGTRGWVPMGVEATQDVPAGSFKRPRDVMDYCGRSYGHIMSVVRLLSDRELVEAVEFYASHYDRDNFRGGEVSL